MESKKFIAFLKKLHKDAGKPILVIADNARYHHSKATQAVAGKEKCRADAWIMLENLASTMGVINDSGFALPL
jgi:hypothetical protein